MAQKETILGNYLKWSHFPLDCESMDYIQNNTKLLAVIAQIAGCDKLIIKGCTGSPRTEGYVYVRTGDDLVGEILYYGGGTGVRCSIATDNIDTTANGETFANAYTKRTLVSGTTGTWAWSDFRALSEITNSALKTLVDGKAAAGHNHDTAYAAKYHNHDSAYAAKNHNHSISEIINLQDTLDHKAHINHRHTEYAGNDHEHDGRYYLKGEIDRKTSALQSAINSKQEQISVEVFNTNSLYNITALRYGKVVTVYVNGYTTSSYTRDVSTVPTSLFPAALIPPQTVWAISIQSNSSGTTNTLDNMHIAWLQKNSEYNCLELGWVKSSRNPASIHATFTYVLP